MTDVRDALDALDLAIGRADGVLGAGPVSNMAHEARRLRTRNGFLGEALVVAVAGGTGSGKSSIVNALVGEQILATGIVRPTTQHATAVFRPKTDVDVEPLFADVGVEHRLTHDGVGDRILIDLPDFDSTAEAHRHVVEDVLPRVDAVIWVLDPEKYADPVLHDGFLRSMPDHGDQFIFVLNKTDRLGDGAALAVDRLRLLLEEDGFASPALVSATAAPLDHAHVENLTAVLEDRWDAKTTALTKMTLDLRRLARDGWSASNGVDARDRGDVARDSIALARATFVSLGVTAYELHHRFSRTTR